MFRPPVDHAMRNLDRNFFRKTVLLAAAKVFDLKRISGLRTILSNELLKQDRISPIRRDPTDKNAKSLLFRPEIQAGGTSARPWLYWPCSHDIALGLIHSPRQINMDWEIA